MKYNLSFKYSIFSIIMIVVFTSVYTIIFLDMQFRTFERQLSDEAASYSKILESSIAENVVSLRIDRIREHIFFLKQNPLLEYAYVIDKEGKILSDGLYRSNLLHKIPTDEFHQNAIVSNSLLLQYSDSLVEASMPIELGTEKLGFVRVALSKSQMNSKMILFRNASILLGAIFIVFGSVLTYLVVKKISRPLNKLTKYTHDISRGNFNRKIKINTTDELSKLANAFNDMSMNLEETRTSLIKAKEEAENSNKLKTDFLAQISHEIRTPISTLLNYTTLIKDMHGPENSELNEYFEIINNAGKRITRTVDLTLNMSEIIRGKFQPTFELFDLSNDVLKGLYNEFMGAARLKNLEFIYEESSKNYFVNNDIYTTTQIFQNLIDNAIKYTNEGYVKIICEKISSHVIVSIIDSGEGISEEFQLDMFEPFRQEEQGYTRKYEGAGLGLALVYKYCELTKTKIEVDSQKGEGTTFRITFNNSDEKPLFTS